MAPWFGTNEYSCTSMSESVRFYATENLRNNHNVSYSRCFGHIKQTTEVNVQQKRLQSITFQLNAKQIANNCYC